MLDYFVNAQNFDLGSFIFYIYKIKNTLIKSMKQDGPFEGKGSNLKGWSNAVSFIVHKY